MGLGFQVLKEFQGYGDLSGASSVLKEVSRIL